MEKFAFVLSVYGSNRAVILAVDEKELLEKLPKAIAEEVEPEGEVTVKLTNDRLGDWGESTDITASYVNEGSLIENTDIEVVKTVTY
jgi:hypothetical protein